MTEPKQNTFTVTCVFSATVVSDAKHYIGKCPSCHKDDTFGISPRNMFFHCYSCRFSGKVESISLDQFPKEVLVVKDLDIFRCQKRKGGGWKCGACGHGNISSSRLKCHCCGANLIF